MCGIVGIFGNSKTCSPVLASKMAEAISSRGPDGFGTWHDSSNDIALAHRRLSILELSPAGVQPMVSHSGRFVITFNGEIYNHNNIRHRLEGTQSSYRWAGRSDTETLLAALEAWGIRQVLDQVVGMFALAVWDRETKTLTLARDRFGEKPLYYGESQGVFLFASELKAFFPHPSFLREIDRDSLAYFLKYAYVPSPRSIYKGINKLSPGCFIEIRKNCASSEEAYWSSSSRSQSWSKDRFTADSTKTTYKLDKILTDSVRAQMVADVPVGAFLSGGIDSSLIVSIMQSLSVTPVETYTIGFDDALYDEANYARKVARHLGTNHHEVYVSAADARNVIPLLPTIYDEPFADSSQIPTYLVCKLARRDVKVCLSGDGGDELFGGYSRYLLAKNLWTTMSRLPMPIRAALAFSLKSINARTWNNVYGGVQSLIPTEWRVGNAGAKLHKLATLLKVNSSQALYAKLTSFWEDPELAVKKVTAKITDHQLDIRDGQGSLVEAMMLTDLLTYLPDDILTKVDRAAMAVSLETRIPFLDPQVVEFAARLPISRKIHNGESKQILRELLYQYLPRGLVDRPKMGFSIPVDDWLRGPLRDWAEALLEEQKIEQAGYLDSKIIRQKFKEHLSGECNWQYSLWNVLMFQAWNEQYK